MIDNRKDRNNTNESIDESERKENKENKTSFANDCKSIYINLYSKTNNVRIW